MKNLLLLLLLANILYFLWGMLGGEAQQPGTAIVEEADLGPPLNVTIGRERNGVDAVPVAGRLSDLEAVIGRSCVTIGPFKERDDADTAVLAYSSDGKKSSVRSTQAEIFVGHWVQIRNVANNNAAKTMLKKLSDGGLSDAYLVRTEDEGLKISLGLFDDIEGAEKTELQARSLDLPADIKPRTADRVVFFVDIALPPGQGASAIMARYGEDKVLLRDSATCPR
jgi:hypothetical protein